MSNESKHEHSQDEIWDHYQNEGIDSFSQSKPRLEYIIRKIAPGLKLLNVGVGGAILEELAIEKGIDVHSLDPNERAINTLRDKFNLGNKARIGYSQKIPFDDDMFDVIVMSEVLEHLSVSEFDTTLSEVTRVLIRQGLLLATVPFEEDLSSNIIVCPHCSEKFHRWGHQLSFGVDSLGQLLRSKGFEIQIVEPRSFPDWSREGAMSKMKSCLRYLLGRFGAGIAKPNIFVKAVNR